MENDTVIALEGIGKKYPLRNPANEKTLRAGVETFFHSFLKKAIPDVDKTSQWDKKTKSFWAVKNVSFRINRGEIVGLIGANGCGKSTLLKMIAKLVPPTEGEIAIRGKVIPITNAFGAIQSELSGRNNIYLIGMLMGLPRYEITQRLNSIVNFADIAPFIDSEVRSYSKGMNSRLVFSVATHTSPSILLLDEVLSVTDHVYQRKCINKIRELADQGTSIVLVSHHTSLVEEICTRSIYLKKGSIVADGDTKTVMREYLREGNKMATPVVSQPPSISSPLG